MTTSPNRTSLFCSILILLGGNCFNFNQSVLGQTGNLHSTACRGIGSEERGVDFVHSGEVVHILQENSGLNDISHTETCGGQNGFHIFQGLAGLLFNAALGKSTGGGINGELAGSDDQIAGADALRVGADGCGSSSGGKVWLAQPFMPFHEDYQWNRYMKRLESVCEKLKEHPDYPVDKEQDGVDEETNLKLYDLYIDKLKHSIYCKRPNNPIQTLEKKRETFRKLSVAKQVQLLISIHPVFGRTPSGGCDMQAIEAGKNVGNSTLNANFSNLKKYYTDVRIIDTSAAGLYEHRSPNLLDFLEDT